MLIQRATINLTMNNAYNVNYFRSIGYSTQLKLEEYNLTDTIWFPYFNCPSTTINISTCILRSYHSITGPQDALSLTRVNCFGTFALNIVFCLSLYYYSDR